METDASFSSTDDGADPGAATPQKPASQGAYHMSSASSTYTTSPASTLADSLRRHSSGVDSEGRGGGGGGGEVAAAATAAAAAFDASVFKRKKGSALQSGDRDPRLSLNSEFAQKLGDIEGQYEVCTYVRDYGNLCVCMYVRSCAWCTRTHLCK